MRQLKLSNKCSHDTLINFGFKKYGMNYKMFIPLYQKNSETLIECEFFISCLENYIAYDVLDTCNKTLYMSYYNPEYSNQNHVLDCVCEKLNKIIKEMEIKNIIGK